MATAFETYLSLSRVAEPVTSDSDVDSEGGVQIVETPDGMRTLFFDGTAIAGVGSSGGGSGLISTTNFTVGTTTHILDANTRWVRLRLIGGAGGGGRKPGGAAGVGGSGGIGGYVEGWYEVQDGVTGLSFSVAAGTGSGGTNGNPSTVSDNNGNFLLGALGGQAGAAGSGNNNGANGQPRYGSSSTPGTGVQQVFSPDPPRNSSGSFFNQGGGGNQGNQGGAGLGSQAAGNGFAFIEEWT